MSDKTVTLIDPINLNQQASKFYCAVVKAVSELSVERESM
jgi:hypothetical protein